MATKLSERGWNRWGKMTKYYDYDRTHVAVPEEKKYALGERDLKKGNEGEDVKQLQSMLVELGFSCGRYGADGEFGSATQDAVEAFQYTHGLTVDGIVTAAVVAKMQEMKKQQAEPEQKQEEFVPTEPNVDDLDFGHRTLKKGCTGSDVKAMQEALIDLGFSCGKYGSDGDFGSATKKAVEAFQKAHGLTVDGIAGENTFEKLKQELVYDGDPMDEPTKTIVVTGGTVNIRELPNTSGKIMKVAKKGQEYSATGKEENGWFGIYVGNEYGWISGKYAEVKE